MKSKLITLIQKGDVDTTQLNEQDISTYVQTVQTVDYLKARVVEPIERMVEEPDTFQPYEDANVTIDRKESNKIEKYTNKQLIGLVKNLIFHAETFNSDGRHAAGVRRFDGVLAMDIDYFMQNITRWQSTVLGQITERKTTYECALTPQRAILDALRDPTITELNPQTALMYVAAQEYVKSNTKNLIKPFEEVFKAQARTDENRTIFSEHHYGAITVALKAIPRKESDYKATLKDLALTLAMANETQPDGQTTFLNKDLTKPSMYVALNYIKSMIDQGLAKQDVVIRKEIAILHRPAQGYVLVN